MPSINIFQDDAFSLASLTAAIQSVPYAPGRISASNLFTDRPINTLDAYIEQENGVLELLPVVPRGAPAARVDPAKRVAKSFRVPHVPAEDLVTADQITGVRAFGSETEVEAVARVVANRFIPMRNSIEYTIESHRLLAIKGSFVDSVGAERSLFTEFGVTQVVVSFALATAATKVRAKCQEVLEAVEDGLGGLSFSGVRVFCGKNFWSGLISHDSVEKTYLNTQQAASLRGDTREAFEFGGLSWERYRGTSAVKIGDDEAFAVPEGVVDLFLSAMSPADYIETAGTMGQRIFAKQWETEGGKGVKLEAQANMLNICTRPAAVVKLTK
ncbi:MAG: major capsid protein [Candidatus Dactylopiibacterium sp.]|nr:major capsid protein [Candidatus Dactylopiibacterium sp.]